MKIRRVLGYIALTISALLAIALLFALRDALFTPELDPPPHDAHGLLILSVLVIFAVFDAPLALMGAWCIYSTRSKSVAPS